MQLTATTPPPGSSAPATPIHRHASAAPPPLPHRNDQLDARTPERDTRGRHRPLLTVNRVHRGDATAARPRSAHRPCCQCHLSLFVPLSLECQQPCHPSARNEHRVVRNVLVALGPRRRPRADQRFEREISNDLWQIDATRILLVDDTESWAVNLLDDHSRYLLAPSPARPPPGSWPGTPSSSPPPVKVLGTRFPPTPAGAPDAIHRATKWRSCNC